MLLSEPLPEMSNKEAIDRMAELYVTYVDKGLHQDRVRSEIAGMRNPVDIESVLVDIGKALQLTKRGLEFSTA